MEFVHRHPSVVGGVIAIAMMVFYYSYDKRLTADEGGLGWQPAVSNTRDKRLAQVRKLAELAFVLAMVPLLFSLHRGDHVTTAGRHFEYLMVLTGAGMLAFSGVVFSIWWLLDGFMSRNESADAASG